MQTYTEYGDCSTKTTAPMQDGQEPDSANCYWSKPTIPLRVLHQRVSPHQMSFESDRPSAVLDIYHMKHLYSFSLRLREPEVAPNVVASRKSEHGIPFGISYVPMERCRNTRADLQQGTLAVTSEHSGGGIISMDLAIFGSLLANFLGLSTHRHGYLV